MSDDDLLQEWLDAREIDTKHAAEMARLRNQLRPLRTFEEMRADFRRLIELKNYAAAIGVPCP